MPAGLCCLPVPLPKLSFQLPHMWFFVPFQFFRAFSKKAEDGIRITSEYWSHEGFLPQVQRALLPALPMC